MDRLIREGNPPVGQLASPIPQYKKPGSTDYEAVEGQHGAPFAILKDASGNVVSPATDAKLEQVKSELELVKSELQTIKANQLSGDQKVQLSGTIVELAVGANIAVTAGSTVTLYEHTTKQYPVRSIRAAAVGYSEFNKAELAIRFWGHVGRMSSFLYALRSEVVEVNSPYIRGARAECEVYGGFCRVTLTNLMTTDATLASFVVLGVI